MERLDQPKGIIIHHSATRDTNSISYDAIAKYHTGKNGWEAIGYHYLIESVEGNPRVYTGRGLQYMGAHCVGKNDHIGICVVGDYDKQHQIGDGKLGLMVKLISGLLTIYPDLTVDDIHYHREFAHKTCPGAKFPNKTALKHVLEGR